MAEQDNTTPAQLTVITNTINADESREGLLRSSINPSPLKRKRSTGRRKIPIEQIQNQDARLVCFSKRRSGLFRKAYELSVLCGAHVEVIAFSPAGKPYSCAYPSNSPSMFAKEKDLLDQNVVSTSNSQTALSRQVSELTTRIEAAKRKKEALQETVKGIRDQDIWSADVSKMELAELEALKKSLDQVRAATGPYPPPLN